MNPHEAGIAASIEVRWVATGYGALDVSSSTQFAEGTELIVVPTKPGLPLALPVEGALLWRRLVAGPVSDLELDESEQVIVREMAEAGVASTLLDHPARIHDLPTPWLSSPTHELVYALVQSVAREIGVSIVFIKGPALQSQGLRERTHSGDVDLWADPEDIGMLASALKKWGWEVQPDILAPINHSVTLVPTTWGCEVDLHRRMPGLGLEDSDAFRVVEGFSTSMRFGTVRCAIPQVEYHAVLAALHFMRPEVGVGARQGAVDRAVALLGRIGENVVSAVDELDASIALKEALELALPEPRFDSMKAHPPHDWYWRGQPTKARAYWAATRELPLRLRVKLAYRLLWPEQDVMRASDERRGLRPTSLNRARLRRLKRGFVSRV